ncbi:MAG TPA: hypothetical protein VN875_00125 [Candidatus Binatus sp.]|nr:hypothetical protein [Candidatus Binatus sp.]
MSSWWSEGETGAIQVYRQSFTGYLATVAVSAAILVLISKNLVRANSMYLDPV